MHELYMMNLPVSLKGRFIVWPQDVRREAVLVRVREDLMFFTLDPFSSGLIEWCSIG